MVVAFAVGAVLWSAPVHAAEEAAPSAAAARPAPALTPPGATDSALTAVLGGELRVRLVDGREQAGVLVRFTSDAMMLEGEGAEVTTVPRAQVVELRLTTPPPVDDQTLASALDEKVWMRLRDGREPSGLLLAYSAEALTIVDGDSVVTTVRRAEITDLRIRATRRQFGVNLSLLPGIMLDVDAGLFRAYINGSIVFPAALDGKLWGFSTGLGLGIPVVPSAPQLKLDVLSQFNLMGVASNCSACNYPTAHVFGFGAAVGMHTTFDSGFTMGFTIPVLGYSVTPSYHGTTNAAVGYYFLSSAVSMPLGFLGYRF